MKHIFVNLKRFDVSPEYGGVNSLTDSVNYGKEIVKGVSSYINQIKSEDNEFVFYLPEADLISAIIENNGNSKLRLGCQGVYKKDVEIGGNFGAFTTERPASAMKSIGINDTLIGHIEERNKYKELFSLAGSNDLELIDKVLSEEVKAAQNRGLNVLFCVGEREDEVNIWKESIKREIEVGLKDADLSKVVIAYEPVWAIGPGKTPAGKEHIEKVAKYIKSIVNVDVVYGGGLKKDNAKMLSSIKEIDGGLIALTNFTTPLGFYPDQFKEIVDIYFGRE